MDPFAHTLLGTALARSPLGRRQGLDTAALVIGANLPDLDVIAHFSGRDASLYFRRGCSHGLPALLVLPLVLWLGLLLWNRWRPGRESPRAARLLLLSTLAVWSHPALDWLNTYGVRLLYPLKGDWFYGDTLFIMDPWIWLLLGGATFLARPKLPEARWVAIAIVLCLPMALAPIPIPTPARAIFFLALFALAGARYRLRGPAPRPRLALIGIALALTYVLTVKIGQVVVRTELENQLEGSGKEILMVGPLPVDPLHWDVIVREGDRYLWGRSGWIEGVEFHQKGEIAIGPAEHPAVLAAKRSPSVRGFVNWMRFPFYEVQPADDGSWRVFIMDARYTRERTGGFGGAVVEVPATISALRDSCDSCPRE